MLLYFYRQWYWWVVKYLNIYAKWSKLYQKYDEKFYNEIPKWKNIDPKVSQELMNKIQWVADGFKELGDAFHHPDVGNYIINTIIKNNFQNPIDLYKLARENPSEATKIIKTFTRGKGQPEISFDCDDFAIWATVSLEPKYDAKILNIVWLENNKPAGHNVCLYSVKNGNSVKYYYIGNWGKIGPFYTTVEVVTSILMLMKETQLIGWHIFEIDELLR